MNKETAPTISNLINAEAIEKLKELAEKSRSCFFVTSLGQIPSKSRPMSLQQVNERGELVFISSSESDKNNEIKIDDNVQLYFQNNSNAEFLWVYGKAVISTDKSDIKKYWTNFAKAWFTDENDPTVTIIKIKPIDAYYWDSKNGKTIAFIKMAISAFTPIQLDDDGVEGSLEIN